MSRRQSRSSPGSHVATRASNALTGSEVSMEKTCQSSISTIRLLTDYVEGDAFHDLKDSSKQKRVIQQLVERMATTSVDKWSDLHRQVLAYLSVRYRLSGSPFQILLRDPRVKVCAMVRAELVRLRALIEKSGPNWFDFLKSCDLKSLSGLGRVANTRTRVPDSPISTTFRRGRNSKTVVAGRERRESISQEDEEDEFVEDSESRSTAYKQVSQLLNRISAHPADLASPLSSDFSEIERRNYYYVLKLPADEELLPYSVPFSQLSWNERVELRKAPELSLEDAKTLPRPYPGECADESGAEDEEFTSELNAVDTVTSKTIEEVQEDVKIATDERQVTVGKLLASVVPENVRVMIAKIETKRVDHDFEKVDPWCSDSDHSWNHWKPAPESSETGSEPPSQVLLLRAEWKLAIDGPHELLSRFDLLALMTRRRVFPSDLCRPQLLRAICPELRNSRHARASEAYAHYYDETSVCLTDAYKILEKFERRVRMSDPPEKETPVDHICHRINNDLDRQVLDIALGGEPEIRRPTSRQRR